MRDSAVSGGARHNHVSIVNQGLRWILRLRGVTRPAEEGDIQMSDDCDPWQFRNVLVH